MKTFLKILISLILISTLVFYTNQERIISNIMSKVVENNFNSNLLDELPDGLHVLLCGAGSPLPDVKRAGPCAAIIAGKQIYIIDSGAGSSKNLTLFKIPQGEINGVLLTHFHSDHIDGLGELILQRWVNGTSEYPLPVYGPEGVEEVVNGFNLAYAQDSEYRIAHHGADIIIPGGKGAKGLSFSTPKEGELKLIINKDGLSIYSLLVDHGPVKPSVAYRFDYKERSIVISGDTKKSANLEKFSNNVDVLIHEALNPDLVANITQAAQSAGNQRIEKITTDILNYHTTPIEAAEIARDASVKHLLFYHIVPPLPLSAMEKLFIKGVDDIYSGGVTVGSDGTFISLEANKKSIDVSKIKKLGSLM